MDWTVSKVIEATRGRLTQGNLSGALGDLCTDTRLLKRGDCFIALPGEQFDGHRFVSDALGKGAAAVVVSRPKEGLNLPAPSDAAVIEVPDTLAALGDLARACRRFYAVPVVGITGSNGKTSTKEMIAAILGRRRRVLKNKGNFNNLIGVPLTLLALQPEHEVAVVEMGINMFGEMERLVAISEPNVGVITNIHPAHLEGLESLDRILEEKGKLWLGLGPQDLAVVNLDDERLAAFSARVRARLVTYSSKDPGADVRLIGAVRMEEGGSRFELGLGAETVSVELPLLGMHHVQNALASAAAAWGLGESPETIGAALSAHQPVRQRMQLHALKNGSVLVDDTYNANPKSVAAAVQAVMTASGGKPTVAILGEMRELGPSGPALHRELGRQIGAWGIGRLATLGALGAEIVQGAREAGLSSECCFHARSHAEILAWLQAQPQNVPAWILVKGSRAMAMERVVEGILAS